jgi:hypothetical protein
LEVFNEGKYGFFFLLGVALGFSNGGVCFFHTEYFSGLSP